MKFFHRKAKTPARPIERGPSEPLGYLYKPRAAETQPHYEIAPLTDSVVVRVVERHNLRYPVGDGFGEALKRFFFGLEKTTSPLNDEVFRRFPLLLRDQGQSAYAWKWLLPWPIYPEDKRSCWHPWYRDPPTTTGEKVTVETDKEGKKTESKEPVVVKGKLRWNVLHKGYVNVPALGFEVAQHVIDYAHGQQAVGELAALSEIAINRAIRAEDLASVEGSRQSLAQYRNHFEAEGAKGSHSMATEIMGELARLKRKGEAETTENPTP